ncbi:MAG: hypothetical protein K8R69_01740, partial [Deltaproteobacteria bacterium]|nr:hypothetical protein [Deltaproteobacteria bacterium]
MRLSGKDPEAHTEVQTLPNGDREVAWIYPLDDNLDAADGRLYLRDRFVFDASERLLKDFTRELRASEGAGEKWRNYLDLYRREIQKRAWSATDPFVQTFALGVAETYSRGLLPDVAGAREAFTAALYRQADYLHRAADAARRWQPTWKIKSGDPENRYYLIARGDSLELHLVLAVDEDSDASNGRVFLHEKFLLDAATRALKSHERVWEADPQNPGKDSATWVRMLNRKKSPSFAEAEGFLQDLLPELWPKSEPDPLAALRLMGQLELKRTGGFPSRKSPDSELAARKVGIFDAMRDVALESLARRADSSRGWGHRGNA